MLWGVARMDRDLCYSGVLRVVDKISGVLPIRLHHDLGLCGEDSRTGAMPPGCTGASKAWPARAR
jgi:hypothetical protein